MKNKYHINISFKWFDFWVGFFVDKSAKSLYICLLPMLPIKIWTTEHKICPDCGRLMQKIAIDTGDGWALEWECLETSCQYMTEGGIDWPFGSDWMNAKDLERFGYWVV